MKQTWPIVENATFHDGWHLEELCAHLEALYHYDIRNLAVALPPGTTKSLVAFVFFPAWCWIQDPGFRFMGASVDGNLALRDARRSRELVESDWFANRYPEVQIVNKSSRKGTDKKQGKDRSDAGSIYWTEKDGLRFTTSVKSTAIGWHVHCRGVDDPIKPVEATAYNLKKVEEWWTGTTASRRADPKKFRSLIVQQRLALNDLIGYAKRTGYTTLELPMEYVTKRRCVTVVGGDRRTKEGELLVPDRIGPPEIAEMKSPAGLGPYYEAQVQQNPTSEAAVIFTKDMFKNRYRRLPSGGYYVWSWDFRFKTDKDSGSYVVGQCWYRCDTDVYLVKEDRGRWSFKQSRSKCKHGAETIKGLVLIEDKANGPAIENSLSSEVAGLELVPCRGSKYARGNAVSPFIESNVYLPDQPWVDPWVEEVVKYPIKPNDRGDAMCQLLRHTYLPEKGEVDPGYMHALSKMSKHR